MGISEGLGGIASAGNALAVNFLYPDVRYHLINRGSRGEKVFEGKDQKLI